MAEIAVLQVQSGLATDLANTRTLTEQRSQRSGTAERSATATAQLVFWTRMQSVGTAAARRIRDAPKIYRSQRVATPALACTSLKHHAFE